MIDNIFTNIIGFVFLIIVPIVFLEAIGIKAVICYEKYLIVKRVIFSKKNLYGNINHKYAIQKTITMKLMTLISKKIFPNINLRIEIYKDINPKDKNLKPKGKPVMVIKIDKTQGE